jgi:DNA-binding CsgD family transcriptional regulator
VEQIVDGIYEAAVLPDLWPNIMSDIATIADAAGTLLIAVRPAGLAWLSSPAVQHIAAEYFDRGLHLRDERTARMMALGHQGFLTDYDVFSPDEFEHYTVNQELLRPHGYGWGVATAITAPTADSFVVHCERKFEAGPADSSVCLRLDALRPHLARAALLSSHLDMMKARATVDALQALDLPAAVLDRSHKLVLANELMQHFIPSVVQDRTTRVGLVVPAAEALMHAALDNLHRKDQPPAIQSIPLPAILEHSATILHILPLRRAAHDLFTGCFSILILTPVKQDKPIPVTLLRGLFDLTSAEARVAQAVAKGMSLAEIARQSNVTTGTVRSQIKAVFEKTGVHRQAELAALLHGLHLR